MLRVLFAIAEWQAIVDPKTGSTYYYNQDKGDLVGATIDMRHLGPSPFKGHQFGCY